MANYQELITAVAWVLWKQVACPLWAVKGQLYNYSLFPLSPVVCNIGMTSFYVFLQIISCLASILSLSVCLCLMLGSWVFMICEQFKKKKKRNRLNWDLHILGFFFLFESRTSVMKFKNWIFSILYFPRNSLNVINTTNVWWQQPVW